MYIARAHLAATPPAVSAANEVLAPFTDSSPAARAAAALANYLSARESGSDTASIVDTVRDLVIEVEGGEGEEWEEGAVRTLAGTVFMLEQENEEAVATLNEGKGKEDLEWLVVDRAMLTPASHC